MICVMSAILSVIFYCVVPILAQLTCDDAFQCVNQTVTVPDTVEAFDANGYKSAFGLYTTIELTPQKNNTNKLSYACTGSFSCHSTYIQLNRENVAVNCQGTNACSNTTMLSQNTDNRFTCYGLNSCMFSIIEDTNYNLNQITCYGETSCAYTHIKSIETINGMGSYSLYRAIIDSQNITSDLSINLQGEFAGYGAILICRTGDTCKVRCRSRNSCYMFHIQCDGFCSITLSDDVVAPINMSVMAFNSSSIHQIHIKNNDELCNTHPSAVTFDNYMEHFGINMTMNTINEAPICCRGAESCKLNAIKYILTTSSSFICSGKSSCAESRFDANNATVYCEASDSCKDNTRIINAFGVYCLGFWSCFTSEIIRSPYILCSARQSCRNATIYSGGIDVVVYFHGDHSGMNAVMHCHENDLCNIICSGKDSCSNTRLICSGNCTMQCDTNTQCPVKC